MDRCKALDFGRYYKHVLQPNSLEVHPGERVQPGVADGQLMIFLHEFTPEQLMSHLHAFGQLILLVQEFNPEQVILHAPFLLPQSILLVHESSPEQKIVQGPPVHSILS